MPGKEDILPIDGASGRDVEPVDDLGPLLADIAELRGVLELQRSHVPEPPSRRGVGAQFAIAELRPGLLVYDLVVLRLDVGECDAPAFGGGAPPASCAPRHRTGASAA